MAGVASATDFCSHLSMAHRLVQATSTPTTGGTQWRERGREDSAVDRFASASSSITAASMRPVATAIANSVFLRFPCVSKTKTPAAPAAVKMYVTRVDARPRRRALGLSGMHLRVLAGHVFLLANS